MNCDILSFSELQERGIKLGGLANARVIDKRALEAKKISLVKFGQLQPITYIKAQDAIDKGLTVVEFESGRVIEPDDANNFIVVVDGNHRVKAHLNLLNEAAKENKKPYSRELYFMEALNKEQAIDQVLIEMNVCTKTWRGCDYIPSMELAIKEDLPVVKFASELFRKGFPLPSISIFATGGTSLTKKVITDAMDCKIADILKDDKTVKVWRRIYDTAVETFTEEKLKSRLLPGYFLKKVSEKGSLEENAKDLISFLRKLTPEEVESVMSLKGTKAGISKEALIYTSLDTLYTSKMAGSNKSK